MRDRVNPRDPVLKWLPLSAEGQASRAVPEKLTDRVAPKIPGFFLAPMRMVELYSVSDHSIFVATGRWVTTRLSKGGTPMKPLVLEVTMILALPFFKFIYIPGTGNVD